MSHGHIDSMEEVVKILDQAMESPSGLVITFVSPERRTRFISKAYHVRDYERKKTAKMYDDRTLRSSPWDALCFVKSGPCSLRITKNPESANIISIEEI